MNTQAEINVVIIDCQMGNMFSVQHACIHVGLKSFITSDKSLIQDADAAILPGVGAFKEAMDNLKKLDLISPIKDFIYSGKPFMGICLGMQLLFTESEEFGICAGLNVLAGKVVKFPEKNLLGLRIRIPQIGWNQIHLPNNCDISLWENSPLKNISEGEYMYFVHSYFVLPYNTEALLTMTNYEGVQYCSSINYENLFACQFHPEKSGKEGIKIYHNWAMNIRKLKEN